MRNSLRTLVLAWTFVAATLATVAVAEDRAVEEAKKSAASWLAEVDAGSYDASWEHAAALFRKAVTEKAWREQLTAVRSPLGALESRELVSATFTRELPGAPDGEYVVIQYRSRFAGKGSATETVTPMRDPDGRWRVSGYYIR